MPVASITREQASQLFTFCKDNSIKEFFFAKDQGAYFGATVGSHEDKNFKNSIQYLKGMNPDIENKDGSDWYDNALDKFGGDDFGVELPVQWLSVFLEDPRMAKKKMFSIRINTNSVRLVL